MNTRALLISIINVALKTNKLYCSVPLTTTNIEIVFILLQEGYLYSIVLDEDNKYNPRILLKLKYHHNKSVLKYIKLLSKPGKKHYITSKKLKALSSSHRHKKYILSTSKGIVSSEQALNEGIGGEALFEYY